MKVVIVDIGVKNVVALNKKGQFIKLRNNGQLVVGSEVDVPVRAGFSIHSFVRVASAAAAFFLVIGLGYGVYSYNSPFSYIDMDINPSVEITANRYNRIIDIEALNGDGEKLINKESFKNKSLKEGIQGLLQNAIEEGYIKENLENAVMLTVSSKNEKKAAEVEKSIQYTAEEELKAVDKVTRLLVEKVSIQRHEDARNMDVSPGKILLIEKLQKEDSAVKLEDYKDAPVREILKRIKEYKKEEIEINKDVSEKDNLVINPLKNLEDRDKTGFIQKQLNSSGKKDTGESGNDNQGRGPKITKKYEVKDREDWLKPTEQNGQELNTDKEKKKNESPKPNENGNKENMEIKDPKGKDQTSVKNKNESYGSRDQNQKNEDDSREKSQKDN